MGLEPTTTFPGVARSKVTGGSVDARTVCCRHPPSVADDPLHFSAWEKTCIHFWMTHTSSYITCPVERAVPTFRTLRAAWAEHANIDLNLGKTRVWNAAGEEPEGLAAELPPLPGHPPVWVGAHSLPAEQQGMGVLGTPSGSDAFVDAFLQHKIRTHTSLLSKIPAVPDLQAAWLLLLMCAAPRCHYLLRALPPSATAAFARRHDEMVLTCSGALLANDAPPELDALTAARPQLPLHFGGLGLRSAKVTRSAAQSDTLPTLRERHPKKVVSCPAWPPPLARSRVCGELALTPRLGGS